MESMIAILREHPYVVSGLGCLIFFYLLNELRGLNNSAQALSPVEVVEWVNRKKAVILDLRAKEDYLKGHIANALHWPLVGNDARSLLKKYSKQTLILVADQNRKTDKYLRSLKQAGLKELAVLSGGIAAWQKEGLPLIS